MITIDCPQCWLDVEPDMECRICSGTGTLVVYCVRCCDHPADRWQDGEAVCVECATDPEEHREGYKT